MRDEKYYFPFVSEKNEFNDSLFVLQDIYNRIEEELSKKIFECRLMYNVTGDFRYIRKIVDMTDYGRRFSDLLDSYAQKGLYIYGAGNRGERIYKFYTDKNWKGYLDEEKFGGTLNGLNIYKTDSVEPDVLILISNRDNNALIKNKLLSIGVKPENIVIWNEWNGMAKQLSYFDDSVEGVKRLNGGLFLDAGCFNGANTIDYYKWIGDESLGVVAFEADTANYQVCKKNLELYKNVRLLNIGLSDRNETLFFDSKGGSDSSLLNEGSDKIETATIDSIVKDEKVAFIKMDIEGFEEKALNGAAKTISRDAPVLAISIYHKRDDIITIPRAILNCNDRYAFYFRHYFLGSNETVLYAIPAYN